MYIKIRLNSVGVAKEIEEATKALENIDLSHGYYYGLVDFNKEIITFYLKVTNKIDKGLSYLFQTSKKEKEFAKTITNSYLDIFNYLESKNK